MIGNRKHNTQPKVCRDRLKPELVLGGRVEVLRLVIFSQLGRERERGGVEVIVCLLWCSSPGVNLIDLELEGGAQRQIKAKLE